MTTAHQHHFTCPMVCAAALAAATLMSAVPASAQGFTWENATELSFVSTGGNASSTTLGVKSALTGRTGPNAVKLEAGGIRGETHNTTRVATGTPTSFAVTETRTSQKTAESYFARARYDRSFGGNFAFAGGGWERNTFAGVRNRYAGVAGLGRAWVDDETSRFKLDLGATYTIEKDVDPAPGDDEGFGGVRLSVDARRQLTPSVEYATVLLANENLEDTEDLRTDWTNSLTVSLTGSLAFKTSLQLLFDNQPALISVPLSGAPGTNVLTPGDEVDTVLTVALVITL
jgi:putative salt-induced outer membrane protein YdiY